MNDKLQKERNGSPFVYNNMSKSVLNFVKLRTRIEHLSYIKVNAPFSFQTSQELEIQFVSQF